MQQQHPREEKIASRICHFFPFLFLFNALNFNIGNNVAATFNLSRTEEKDRQLLMDLCLLIMPYHAAWLNSFDGHPFVCFPMNPHALGGAFFFKCLLDVINRHRLFLIYFIIANPNVIVFFDSYDFSSLKDSQHFFLCSVRTFFFISNVFINKSSTRVTILHSI